MSHEQFWELLATYGAVERVRNMLESDVNKEIETESAEDYCMPYRLGKLKKVLSDLCAAFPDMFERVHGHQGSCNMDALNRLRRIAYEIEDLLEAAPRKSWPDDPQEKSSILTELEEIRFTLVESDAEEDDMIDGELESGTHRKFPYTISKYEEAGSKRSTFLSSSPKATCKSLHDRKWSWDETIVGRESEKKQIIEWALSPSSHEHPKVISVSGNEGIGKTTLAKLVYGDAQVSKSFPLLLWAVATSTKDHNMDLKSTIVEIIRSLTHQSRFCLLRMSLETLKDRLRGILEGRKYLLVLDDVGVSQLYRWESLRKLLEAGASGSTVILLMSSLCSARSISVERLKLKGLPDEDCWSLFSRCVGIDEKAKQEHHYLNQIGKSIVNKCRRYPLAIKALGSTLSTTRDEQMWKQMEESQIWNSFQPNILTCSSPDSQKSESPIWNPFSLNRHSSRSCGSPNSLMDESQHWLAFSPTLQSSRSCGSIDFHLDESQDSNTSSVEAALTISLQNMPSDLLQCFINSAGLPENKAMSRDHLVYFWMAQGLLQPKEGAEDPRDVGNRYCNELISRTLLRQLYQWDGHDMILAPGLGQSLARCMIPNEVETISTKCASSLENCRHIIWNGDQASLCNGFAPQGLTLPTVRTFMFQKYVGHVEKFVLEQLIHTLSHARVLLLDGSAFGELPDTIGNLHFLRYLSLADNHTLKVLPESICNLVNLQTLDLSGCQQLETLPKDMHKLHNLRHLFLSLKLSHVPEQALQSWSSLHHLKICNCPNLESLSEEIAHLTALRVLQIQDCPQLASLPNKIAQHGCLEELSILNCQMLDLTKWVGLFGLSGLQFLQFRGLTKLSLFPDGLRLAADSLQRLIIGNCENLTALPQCLKDCEKLSEIVIDMCPNIDTLPEEVRAIKSLKSLKIVNCPKLVARGEWGIGEDWIISTPTTTKRRTGLLSQVSRALGQERKHDEDEDGSKRILTWKSLWPWWSSQPKHGELAQPRSVSAKDEESDLGDHQPEIDIQTLSSSSSPSFKQKTDNQEADFFALKELKEEQKCDSAQKCRLPKEMDSHELQDSAQKNFRIPKEQKDYKHVLFLLPENFEFEKDTLIQMWMAGEYIKDELKGDELFRGIFNEQKYLFYSGTDFMTKKDKYHVNNQKIVKFLDQAKHNANSYLKCDDEYMKQRNSCRHAESIQHVSLVCKDGIDGTNLQTLLHQQFNNLRTLLFLGNHAHRIQHHVLDQLFLSMGNLYTLDLSKAQIEELPSSIGHMKELRYLDLSWTLIEWLPDTICFLTELQTLKLKGCSNLCELPYQLQKLTRLRHLEFDVLRQLKIMPERMGALVHLRTLSAFIVDTEDGCKIDELENLNDLTGSFCIAKLENVEHAEEASQAALFEKERLEKLELRWTPSEISGEHYNSDDILEHLQPSKSLQELRILCFEGLKFPDWVSNPKFDKLTHITFYRCKHVSKLPLVEHLPSLKHLHLVKMNHISRIDHRETAIAFPKLEKLEIDEMQGLTSWQWEKRNDQDFANLTQLIVNDCPKLKEFDVVRHLSSLKLLEIRECPKALRSLYQMKFSNDVEVTIDDCPFNKEDIKGKGKIGIPKGMDIAKQGPTVQGINRTLSWPPCMITAT